MSDDPGTEPTPRTRLRVDAVRWTGSNPGELRMFVGHRDTGEPRFLLPGEITGVWDHPHVYCGTHDVWLPVRLGQWVIKGGAGELYPIHADAAVADAEQARAQERAAIARMIRSHFAAADDPLHEDVRILCGRIERGEHA